MDSIEKQIEQLRKKQLIYKLSSRKIGNVPDYQINQIVSYLNTLESVVHNIIVDSMLDYALNKEEYDHIELITLTLNYAKEHTKVFGNPFVNFLKKENPDIYDELENFGIVDKVLGDDFYLYYNEINTLAKTSFLREVHNLYIKYCDRFYNNKKNEKVSLAWEKYIRIVYKDIITEHHSFTFINKILEQYGEITKEQITTELFKI